MEVNLFGILEEEKEINNDNKLLIDKENEYMNYIGAHKERVVRAYEDLKSRNFEDEEIRKAIEELGATIDEHDNSKYSDDEFDAYRRKYYPYEGEISDDVDEEFEIAWKHHYAVNPHHPEHYYNYELHTAIDMPLKYIIEMICDWMSFGDNARQWYYNNPSGKTEKDKVMTPYTIEWTEKLLNLFFPIG